VQSAIARGTPVPFCPDEPSTLPIMLAFEFKASGSTDLCAWFVKVHEDETVALPSVAGLHTLATPSDQLRKYVVFAVVPHIESWPNDSSTFPSNRLNCSCEPWVFLSAWRELGVAVI